METFACFSQFYNGNRKPVETLKSSERRNPANFADPLTVYVTPPADQSFHLSSEI